MNIRYEIDISTLYPSEKEDVSFILDDIKRYCDKDIKDIVVIGYLKKPPKTENFSRVILSIDSPKYFIEFKKNNDLHNEKGPAFIRYDKFASSFFATDEYFYEGCRCYEYRSIEELNQEMNRRSIIILDEEVISNNILCLKLMNKKAIFNEYCWIKSGIASEQNES